MDCTAGREQGSGRGAGDAKVAFSTQAYYGLKLVTMQVTGAAGSIGFSPALLPRARGGAVGEVGEDGESSRDAGIRQHR